MWLRQDVSLQNFGQLCFLAQSLLLFFVHDTQNSSCFVSFQVPFVFIRNLGLDFILFVTWDGLWMPDGCTWMKTWLTVVRLEVSFAGLLEWMQVKEGVDHLRYVSSESWSIIILIFFCCCFIPVLIPTSSSDVISQTESEEKIGSTGLLRIPPRDEFQSYFVRIILFLEEWKANEGTSMSRVW